MLMQVMPVTQFLVSEEVQISWQNEDKPQDSNIKEKKDGKEFFGCYHLVIEQIILRPVHFHFNTQIAASPVVEYSTPPPDQGL